MSSQQTTDETPAWNASALVDEAKALVDEAKALMREASVIVAKANGDHLSLVEEVLATGGDPRVAIWLRFALDEAETPCALLQLAQVALSVEARTAADLSFDGTEGRYSREQMVADALSLADKSLEQARERATKANLADAEFEADLGELLMARGEPERGRYHLRRAIDRATWTGELLGVLRTHHTRLDEVTLTAALQRHEQLLADEGASVDGWLEVHDLLQKLKRPKAAADALQKAWDTAASFQDFTTLFDHADRRSQKDAMQAAARAAAELLSDDDQAQSEDWDNLADQWRKLDETARADRCAAQALDLAEEPQQRFELLLKAAQRTGDHRDYLDAVLAWWPTADDAALLVSCAEALMTLDPSTMVVQAFQLRRRAFNLPDGQAYGGEILDALIAEGRPAGGLLTTLWKNAKTFDEQVALIESAETAFPEWAQSTATRLLTKCRTLSIDRLLEVAERFPEPAASQAWRRAMRHARKGWTNLQQLLEFAIRVPARHPSLAELIRPWRAQAQRHRSTELGHLGRDMRPFDRHPTAGEPHQGQKKNPSRAQGACPSAPPSAIIPKLSRPEEAE